MGRKRWGGGVGEASLVAIKLTSSAINGTETSTLINYFTHGVKGEGCKRDGRDLELSSCW